MIYVSDVQVTCANLGVGKEGRLTTFHEVDQSRRCTYTDSRAALSKQAHLFLDLHVFGELYMETVSTRRGLLSQVR